MLYLLDTNVVSEIQKGTACNRNVRAWLDTVDDDALRLSVMTILEARKGVAKRARQDQNAAATYERRLEAIVEAYGHRIIEIDRLVADEWGKMLGEKEKHRDDMAFAATARVHGLVIVTRNVKHFRGRGVRVLDPFRKSPAVATV